MIDTIKKFYVCLYSKSIVCIPLYLTLPMFSLVNAAKDEDPKLVGLLSYYEEGERVDELVEVVEGVEDLRKVKLSKLKNWMVNEMLETEIVMWVMRHSEKC